MVKMLMATCAVVGLVAATGAYAAPTSDETAPAVHRAVHKHRTARVRNLNTQTDTPQETAAPEDNKPAAVPEYFNHASGDDGSHYAE